MRTMYEAINYMAMRARRLGRSIFHNDAGALTLEWIVIAIGLVVAAAAAGVYIKTKLTAEEKKIP